MDYSKVDLENRSFIKQIKKIFRDLEKTFKQAINDKSYTAALRAKELQLKEILSMKAQQVKHLPVKLNSLQDIMNHFAGYDEQDLIKLNAEIINLK